MKLAEKELKKLAKDVLDLEKDLMYDDSITRDQRISSFEKLVTDAAKHVTEDESIKSRVDAFEKFQSEETPLPKNSKRSGAEVLDKLLTDSKRRLTNKYASKKARSREL